MKMLLNKKHFFFVAVAFLFFSSLTVIIFSNQVHDIEVSNESSEKAKLNSSLNKNKSVLAAADIIIDNNSANVVGTWDTRTSTYDKYGSSYRSKSDGNGSAYLQYTPNITTPGEYNVYEWHPEGSNRPTDAQHIINYNGGSRTINVNQQNNGGQWNLLGKFTFASGNMGYVRINDSFSASSGGYNDGGSGGYNDRGSGGYNDGGSGGYNNEDTNTTVASDAIRFVYAGSSTPQPTPIPVGTDACVDAKVFDFIIVFDHTGSMGQDGNTGETKIAVAKRAAKDFVDIIAAKIPTARIGVVKWAGNQNFPNNSETSVAVNLTNNFNSEKTGIDNIRDLRGQGDIASSCFECGVKLANDHSKANTRANSQKIQIFMTDGNVNQTINGSQQGATENDPAAEDAAMRQAQDGVTKQGIIYYTVGMLGGQHASEGFLRDLASLNGGTYYRGNESEMERIFGELATTFIPSGTINGYVFEDKDSDAVLDSNEPKIPNWTVQLSGGKQIQTNSSGNFSYTALCSGNYTVSQIVQPGWAPTTNTSRSVSVVNGTTYNNIIFGNEREYTISGNVYIDINGNGVKDAGEVNSTTPIIISTDKGDVTVTNGTYSVSKLLDGPVSVSYTSLPANYAVTYPTGASSSFAVNVGSSCTANGARSAACTNGNIINLNFGIKQQLFTISGSIYMDANKNGIKDATESNYSGTPSLTASRGTVNANSNGTYTISNLLPGTVTVSLNTVPQGYSMTYPLNGPPPSFQVSVGPGCSVNVAGGECK